ncbi:hypothetical protein LTR85_012237 [Meristemomyces frigidus]|nr:hypothetical protein LTR85_012237 [Meristemomyces frigidus]
MATSIPARGNAYVTLRPSQRIKVINPSGNQVVDFWAFPTGGPPTWMSMAQTRSKLMKIMPSVDDTFVDTRREAVLKLVEDTSLGTHDMLFPPCDKWRYNQAGAQGHDSCGGNLRTALADYTAGEHPGTDSLLELESSIRRWGWTPEPLNLFMNVPWSGETGKLQVKRPGCEENVFVVFEASVECFVVMSACPNDLLDTNGGKPGAAAYEVLT